MCIPVAIAAATLLMATAPIHSQEKRGAGENGFYRVKFTIRDSSDPSAKGAVRTYSMITAANRKATFRVGDRVPLATASFQPSAPNSAVNTQFNYVDIGVTIECIVADVGGKIAMHGNIDLSTVDRHDVKPGAANPNPTVAQTRLELDTAVDPGKPTIVASIDDPVNMHKVEVEATVTKMD
jgi:hypothetical protein